MKLGDGRKVKMHETPKCDERDRLSSECSRLLSEWLACKDEVKQTKKNAPSYARKVEHMKEAHSKLKAANAKLTQHGIREHGCW
jgi:hypothetical protein